MKKRITFIVLCLITLVCQVFSQSTHLINYDGDCNFRNITIKVSPNVKKTRTTNATGGKIVLNFKDQQSIPDSLKTAIKIAADLWSSYMSIGDTLKLDIIYNNSSTSDISTSVVYVRDSEKQVCYPSSLYKKITHGLTEYSDAKVHINASTNWCVGLGSDNTKNNKKLTIAMIQSIAQSLGYGSSITNKARGITFSVNGYTTVFDNLIFSEDNTYLNSFKKSNPAQLKKFVQQSKGFLYAKNKSEQYKLYAPQVFDLAKSLKTSCDINSIMYHANVGEQVPINRDLLIDDITIELLNEIGWNFNNKNHYLEIIGDGIDKTGIVSGLQAHQFYAISSGDLTEYKWSFMLPLKSGKNKVLVESSESRFIIPALTNEDQYERMSDGSIRGTILLTANQNGNELKTTYNLTLEFKPRISQVKIVSMVPCSYDNSYYDAIIDIFYEGSTYLHADLEEEGSSFTRAYFFDTPFYCRLKINDIDSYGTATLRLVSRNDHGSTNYTYLLPNISNTNQLNSNLISRLECNTLEKEEEIEVYNMKGQLLGISKSTSDLTKYKEKVLILKRTKKQKSDTSKYITK